MVSVIKKERVIYTNYETPLERAVNLERFLGQSSPRIYIKRDDMLGLAGGGNKTRKLEYLMADALNKKATTIITCGAIQSNHCRLTLAAAIKEGLECHLVLEERVANTYKKSASGNNFLYQLLGAASIKVVKKGTDLNSEMHDLKIALDKKGANSYIVPGGGSNEVGALGYVRCLEELTDQCNKQNITPSHLICTSGSAGTHAGLLAGLTIQNLSIECLGISVMRSKNEQSQRVLELSNQILKTLPSKKIIHNDKVTVYDNYVGEGYSIPTSEMIKAIKLLAKTEGILLDPVYTGKAFAGMLDLISKNVLTSNDTLIFIHTGGSPTLFAYQDIF